MFHPIVTPHSASLLTNDLSTIEMWGNDNRVKFSQGKMKQVVISRKRHQDFPPVFVSGHELDISSSFTQLGLQCHLIFLGKPTSTPLLNIHLRNLASSLEPVVFLSFSAADYIQISDSSFSGLLLPCLGWCSQIFSTSFSQSPVQSHPSHQ